MSVNRFFGFVIFLVATTLPAQAYTLAYTLDQMAAGMNVLRAELDGNRVCGIDSKLLNRLPQFLQAKIDEVKGGGELKYLENCEAYCRCGFYADRLRLENSLSPEVVNLETRAKNLKSSDALTCAKNNLWFCESRLLRALKREANF